MRLNKVHTLLKCEGVQASYATLRRFVMDELGWRKEEPIILLEDPPPAQEAQVDFGKMGYIVDDDGTRRVLWALIVTLSFSRRMFVWPALRQTTERLCEGLDHAWRLFGGQPVTIIPDHPKGIVAHPGALTPRLSEAFNDYVAAPGRGRVTDRRRRCYIKCCQRTSRSSSRWRQRQGACRSSW